MGIRGIKKRYLIQETWTSQDSCIYVPEGRSTETLNRGWNLEDTTTTSPIKLEQATAQLGTTTRPLSCSSAVSFSTWGFGFHYLYYPSPIWYKRSHERATFLYITPFQHFPPMLKLVTHRDETFLQRKDLFLKMGRPDSSLLFPAHKDKPSRPALGSWGLPLHCSLNRDLLWRTASPQGASVTLIQQ